MVSMSGLVRLEQDRLVIEFSGSETLIGAIATLPVPGSGPAGAGEDPQVRSVDVPLADVARLTVIGGVLRRPRLQLEVNRVSALANIPWAAGPRCTVSVARADRDRLRELAAELDMTIADAELRELEAPE